MSEKFPNPSRRDFIRLVGIAAASLAGGRLLSACGRMLAAPTATSSAVPTETLAAATATPTATPTETLAAATATPTATPTVTRLPKPDIIRFYPAGKSRVIRTHHGAVWNPDKTLSPGALRLMVDESIRKLTGLEDARQAWGALFRPGEKIAIKVNAFSNSRNWTHALLVQQVTDSLQEAGIASEQITIFDMATTELKTAGFPVNSRAPGVLCKGMDFRVSSVPSNVMGKEVNLANILISADAIINIPILKSHPMSGISFAMKNHYGSIQKPATLHSPKMEEIADLNALPEIKERSRLIIGDALSASLHFSRSFPYWQEDWVGDSIFMSFDPVAHDSMGLELLARELEKSGTNPASMVGLAAPAFQRAVELGLGTNEMKNIEFVELAIA
jgi:uncharacterized protein (DUF362 family)